jgi:hypothetical protein
LRADRSAIRARARTRFETWPIFAAHLEDLQKKESAVSMFEEAAEAVIAGDIPALERLLHEQPTLIRARSTREHRATLLHYAAANGVENYRQKTPQNAVAVAKALLAAGVEVDAEADMYGEVAQHSASSRPAFTPSAQACRTP